MSPLLLRLVANLDTVSKMLEAKDLNRGHLTGKDFASEGDYDRFGHKGSCPDKCQEDHDSERALDHPNFKQYELEMGSARRWRWGAGEMPPNLPHYIHRGILMESMCEVLSFALKRSAESLFALSKLLAQKCHQLFANRIRSRPSSHSTVAVGDPSPPPPVYSSRLPRPSRPFCLADYFASGGQVRARPVCRTIRYSS